MRKMRGIAQWAINFLVLGVLLYEFTPASDLLCSRLTHLDPLQKADYIVVLGGNLERTVEGARLYHDHWADKVIVTSNGPNADLMKQVAIAYGVPESAIIVDREPNRTADHPLTIERLGVIDKRKDRLLIVTSAAHTSRSRACFLHDGYANFGMTCPGWAFGGEFYPTRQNWQSNRGVAEANIYEALAWGYYWIRGWV